MTQRTKHLAQLGSQVNGTERFSTGVKYVRVGMISIAGLESHPGKGGNLNTASTIYQEAAFIASIPGLNRGTLVITTQPEQERLSIR